MEAKQEEKSPFEEMFQDLSGDAEYFKNQLSGPEMKRNKFIFLCDSSIGLGSMHVVVMHLKCLQEVNHHLVRGFLARKDIRVL